MNVTRPRPIGLATDATRSPKDWCEFLLRERKVRYTADGGGSNRYRLRRRKYELWRFAQETGHSLNSTPAAGSGSI